MATSSSEEEQQFTVNLSHQGRTVALDGGTITTSTTGAEFHAQVYEALQLSPEEFTLKLLYKGKRIVDNGSAVFAKAPTKPPKILVMTSAKTSVDALNAKKQDPTIRGFDQEKKQSSPTTNNVWGTLSQRDKNYKFGRLQECAFHEFGHRPTDTTPHAFAARQLLEKLSSDPGIIAILKERQLVVGTLGEMDPIDDRLMQKKQTEGSCLLGYNTNRGLRIDIKLRTDNLATLRPYPQLVATLIHELSHNWVGEHNELFWANFGQMRLEYLIQHKRLQGQLYQGKTSAELAGLDSRILENIYHSVLQELTREMAQHHLHPRMIEQPLKQRYDELQSTLGQRLGGGGAAAATTRAAGDDRRTLALEAAERRAREQQEKERERDGGQ